MKRPCFLFASYPFGGIENFVRNLQAEIAPREDIASDWLFIEWSPGERVASLPLVSSNWTIKAGVVTRSRVRRLEERGRRFDAVFFNSMVALPLLGEFARRTPAVLWLDATPRLLAEHGEWWHGGARKRTKGKGERRWKTYLTSRAYAKADFLLPSTDMVRSSLVDDYAVSENKIRNVPLGIDTRFWTRATPRNATPRQRGERTRILFVGGDFERKGGDLLLNIARREEFRECEFHIVTRSLPVSFPDNVRVHTGVGPNSPQLLALYDRADVFVLPTRADLAPTNVILEAMAMELPVISTAVGAIDRVVLDGTTGYIVPVGDEDALGERLHRLVSSRSLREELGRNGRRNVEAEHDIRHSSDTIIDIMKEASRL